MFNLWQKWFVTKWQNNAMEMMSFLVKCVWKTGWLHRKKWTSVLSSTKKKKKNLTTYLYSLMIKMGLPWWLSGKKFTCSAADLGSIPGSGNPLEECMATHSSILAWRIASTEEPGGLQSVGSQSRTRLNWLSTARNIIKMGWVT